jgi:flagellin
MSMSIVTNVSSLIAQENLRVNNDFQSRTIERLTSGYRINSSGDDAAGLAVANKFRTQIAELNQGVRNANDGLSAMQIVDGGLNNIAKIMDRLTTLATQSASATFNGSRATLQSEYDSLLTEIDRQASNIGLGASGEGQLEGQPRTERLGQQS